MFPVDLVLRAVHPHVRGDNLVLSQNAGGFSGSPPRAWGQLSQVADHVEALPVHPHVRGDNPIP